MRSATWDHRYLNSSLKPSACLFVYNETKRVIQPGIPDECGKLAANLSGFEDLATKQGEELNETNVIEVPSHRESHRLGGPDAGPSVGLTCSGYVDSGWAVQWCAGNVAGNSAGEHNRAGSGQCILDMCGRLPNSFSLNHPLDEKRFRVIARCSGLLKHES